MTPAEKELVQRLTEVYACDPGDTAAEMAACNDHMEDAEQDLPWDDPTRAEWMQDVAWRAVLIHCPPRTAAGGSR